ncbi:glycosyltransferase family 4 protein [Peribacillus simplex]|uniref:Glycosyltransferase family 4 protein n=1 Tax=Peribacillus simplex TaxID=1478 RepID=A0A8B5XWD0_9BACI|nr:glycosyltransferase family 4 protein [Peribacillus simplex]TVX79111.1 glycosyltransferase family 4 protein [Peribacillus simplex]
MEKIIFITRNMKAGGAERVIAQLANYFNKTKIQCTIITLDNEEIFYELDNNINIFPIGRKSRNPYIDKIQKYREIRRYVQRSKPSIVLALPEEIGIYVIPALIGTNVPVVVSERNNPWVMPWKKETRLLRKLFYPLAAGFVFQTEQAASFFSSSIRKKSIVLPNPLDLNRIPLQRIEKRRKEVVGAGRLDKQKNFPLLIQSFAKFHKKYPEYVLTIYGEGALRGELEKLAVSLLPEGTYSFPGKTKDLLEKINGASMFILSSDYEGMPNVVIEAMAMGMPVVSTDCPSGGSAELIQNGKNGILVPVGDRDSLALAMSKIAGSDDFANKLGKNAQEVKKLLNSDVVSKDWKNYLDTIVGVNS